MFKKLLLVFVALFAVVTLAACDPTEEPVERTFVADGVYTAFSEELTSAGGPQITWVSVTIENDEITAFNIDVVQSAQTKNAEEVVTGFAFNAQSKKELGYAYRMHGQRDLSEADYKTWLEENDKLEWFEQAALIEAFMVENGPEAVTKTDNVIDNIASVTIKDAYTALAAEAVQNAKDGKTFVPTVSADDITWVEATVNADGEFTALKIDVLQGQFSEGAFSWKTQSKQELGYAYRMHGQRELSEADYKTWLEENDKLEWFEQANIISAFVLENGIDAMDFEADGLAAVSISTDAYATVLTQVYADFE